MKKYQPHLKTHRHFLGVIIIPKSHQRIVELLIFKFLKSF